MRSRRIFKIFIFILVIFWGLKFLSDIFFVKGEISDLPNSIESYDAGNKIFPFSSEDRFLHAYSLLSAFEKDGDLNKLKKSIDLFKYSIRLNQLNYFSFLYLGNALMQFESPDPDIFKNGLTAIRRSSFIRKFSTNVNTNTLEIYLSMWPFLSKEDRLFTDNLMKKSIGRIDGNTFKSIIEIWGLYSQDKEFLQSIFNPAQRYYNETIKLLGKKQLLIDVREKFLAEKEIKTLQKIEKNYNEFKKGEISDLKILKILYSKLFYRFIGYNSLIKNSNFRKKAFNRLKKEVLTSLIENSLKNNKNSSTEIFKYLNDYIDTFNTIRDLDNLQKILSQNSFFSSSDLNRQLIKYRILFASGQFSKIITELEQFRESLAFLKREHIDQYSKILLLLADSYISSRLLTRSVDILKEVEKRAPGLIDLYWRLFKIEKVIGEDEFFKKLKEEKYKEIKESNLIIFNRLSQKQVVYFFDKTSFRIVPDPNFEGKIKNYSIFQIFIGNKIFKEFYTKNISFPIIIDLPPEYKDSKITVNISLKK